MNSIFLILILGVNFVFCFSFSAIAEVTNLVNKISKVSFIENNGQWHDKILYKGMSISTNVYLLKNGLSFSQKGKAEEDSKENPILVWNMKFINPNLDMKIEGGSGKESVYSYLSGNDPEKWVIHPTEFKNVNYKQIYKNIDLQFYGSENHLEYDYLLHPGSNINTIQSYYEGIKGLNINKIGDLEILTSWSKQIQKAPVAWQIINGIKQIIEVHYVLLNDSTFAFEAGNGYNKNYDLIIDPLFQMVWGSYTQIPGGNNNINYCFSNAMDKDGNVYLTGMVDGSFPITPGAYSGPGNVYPEIFVAKFSSDGTTLLYWTYLPGSSSEFGTSIAVDDSGRAYLTGVVDLNITGLTNFPSTPNAYQPVHNSGADAFLTVLNSTGSGLVYSSFLGGTGSEEGYGVALGGPGIAYLTGYTSLGNFPVKATSIFPTGDNDVFVAKFDINQSGNNSLIYSTRIGGGAFSYCHGKSLAVNNAGNVFITGTISCSFGTPVYPTTPGAYNSIFNTGQDGVMFFVSKLSANTPVTLDYSTYLAPGTANGIAVDVVTDDAFIAGTTYTFAFPVTPGALQPLHAGAGGTDAFAVRLNSTGSALVYSTFLGGSFYDVGSSIAVNSIGEAYIAGISQDSFPTSTGGFQPANAGTYDFFAVNLNASGTGYGCGGSTYIGGSDADYTGSFYDYPSPHVSLRDHAGNNDTICISSTTHSQDFPTTVGSYGPLKVNGIDDQPVFFKLTCIPLGAVPNVNLSSSDTSWCDKKAIDFFDLSTNNPTSWQWFFQGAVPDTSTAQNPTGIYYPSYGSFDVTLVACNQYGCDSISYPGFINEYQLPLSPSITFITDTLFSTPALFYQWYDLNGMIPGQTNSFFVPSQPGTYFVVVSDSLDCSSPSNYYLITGVLAQQYLFQTKIIPNPFHQKIVVECYLQKSTEMEISVVDVTGRTVYYFSNKKNFVGENKFTLYLSELRNGIYFCKIKSNENIQTIKLIKN